MRLSGFLLIVGLLFCCTTTLQADGSPVVQSLTAKGDYLFISENSGLYTLWQKDGRFYWKVDHGYYPVTPSPDGKIWSMTRMEGTEKNFPARVRCFDGNAWIEYMYPLVKQQREIRYLFSGGKTLLVTEDFYSRHLVLYEFDGNLWKERTHFPIETGHSIPHIYTLNDTIAFMQNPDYYSYSISLDKWEWTTTYEERKAFMKVLSASYSETLGRGYKIEREGSRVTAFVSPEGNRLTLSPDVYLCSTYGSCSRDGYFYVQLYTIPDDDSDKIITQLWSDRSGEWEMIGTGNRDLSYIEVGDNRVVWGSKGNYLAFLRDGQWIEIALLPPELDSMAYDEDDEYVYVHPMRERFPDAQDMELGVINDPDGYVNVRSHPDAKSPVIAIIPEDIQFLYKTTGNAQWSEVLLPSGTTGYVSSSRIR